MAKKDPDERFVISAITRAGIAALLNEHLGNCEVSEQTRTTACRAFTSDDDRLTSGICGKTADEIYRIEEMEATEGWKEEEMAGYLHNLLVELDILKPAKPPKLRSAHASVTLGSLFTDEHLEQATGVELLDAERTPIADNVL